MDNVAIIKKIIKSWMSWYLCPVIMNGDTHCFIVYECTCIFCCYRPPQGNILCFLDKLESTCQELHANGNCEIILIGDMNLNITKRRDPKVKAYLDSIRRMGMTQLISEPTHENTQEK